MTVCIAASCRDEKKHALVLCADAKGSTPLGSSESTFKIKQIGHGWRCLTAGNEDDITALVELIKGAFIKLNQVDETNVVGTMQAALRARKTQKADEYTSRKWGMTFEEFRRRRADFPEDEYRADIAAIGHVWIVADLILAGFDQFGFSMIVHAHGEYGVQIKEHFAVAGEGSYLAQFGLLHRDHHDYNPLPSTIYCVYEAKKYAERVASVGKTTHLMVLWPDGTWEGLNKAGCEYLDAKFDEFGPHGFKKSAFAVPDGSFMSFPKKTKTD